MNAPLTLPDDLPAEIVADTLHDYLYQLTLAVCRDKEYAYRAFAACFREVSERIFAEGGTEPGGETLLYGIKSDYNVQISWTMSRRLNFMKFNSVAFVFEIISKSSEPVTTFTATFELSHGHRIL